ncbi:MAG: NAD+ synthase [Desulfobulbaceae bacterium]|nr:NAD+ synthase [Desulfobulbaceae bacterium]
MKIVLAQTNPIIGDFKGNSEKILSRLNSAEDMGCELLIFPELTLCGYPPRDLLERRDFLEAQDRALEEMIPRVGNTAVILGVAETRTGPGKPLYNSAVFISAGKVIHRARKQLLPTYDVFDEQRYFEKGEPSLPVLFKGMRLGITICEDIWYEPSRYVTNPVDFFAAGVGGDIMVDLLINISASPFYYGKMSLRRKVFGELCRQRQLPLVYVNQVGGQDSLLFDGHSMVIAANGEPILVGKGFAEDSLVFDTAALNERSSEVETSRDDTETVLRGLCMGLRDYLGKSGFKKVVLGLSGGIDSAVTAAIACLALGPENVTCVAMPSPYTSQQSIDDAETLCVNFGCAFEVIRIAPIMEAYDRLLAPHFAGRSKDVTEQNIQARIRGNILMALSNKFGSLLLSTGNKSEMAVGYCTLYGDMSGGLAILADVPKLMVYALAERVNHERELIPSNIIIRPPTAELKPDQFDQDDLPPYEILDPIVAAYMEECKSVGEIVASGYDRTVVEDVVRRIKLNEYKRKQAPLSLKVTSKAFGHGRRYPTVQKFPG